MRVFDEIAPEWNARNRRPRIPPGFIELMPAGAIVLDAGCGQGRNIPALLSRASQACGVDSSPKLIGFARQNLSADVAGGRVKLSCGKMQRLPHAAKAFDVAYCFNAFHHLRSKRDRLAALCEFCRVLKPHGVLAISVWNRNQAKFSKLKKSDYVGYLKNDGTSARRYYHFFDERELSLLLESVGFAVVSLFYEKNGRKAPALGADNLCVVAKL